METSEKKDQDFVKTNLIQAMIVAAREEYDGEYAAAVVEAKQKRERNKKDGEFSLSDGY